MPNMSGSKSLREFVTVGDMVRLDAKQRPAVSRVRDLIARDNMDSIVEVSEPHHACT